VTKLIEYTDQYDRITTERMTNEHHLCTLKEQIAFEHEYYQRRQEEFQQLDQIQYDVTRDFNRNEFQQIIQRIR
jgi:hypothetical protein